jgi:hypothetical protein
MPVELDAALPRFRLPVVVKLVELVLHVEFIETGIEADLAIVWSRQKISGEARAFGLFLLGCDSILFFLL